MGGVCLEALSPSKSSNEDQAAAAYDNQEVVQRRHRLPAA